jgi:hypothetical protein
MIPEEAVLRYDVLVPVMWTVTVGRKLPALMVLLQTGSGEGECRQSHYGNVSSLPLG